MGGILLKRLYQEGEPVKAGQALFQIDRAPYEIAAAERARAEQTARSGAAEGLAEAKAVAQKTTTMRYRPMPWRRQRSSRPS